MPAFVSRRAGRQVQAQGGASAGIAARAAARGAARHEAVLQGCAFLRGLRLSSSGASRNSLHGVLGRDFPLYLASRLCSGAALTMLRAGVSWHVFELSGSAFHLGLVGLVQFVPALGLSLVGGLVADSFDRRRVMQAAQLVPLACAGLLSLATERGDADLFLLYGLVFLVSAAAAFENPARHALLPSLVARESFPRAVTIASTAQALAFASGPALGGLVIAERGLGALYGCVAALVASSLAALVPLRSGAAQPSGRALGFEAVREGLRFVRSRPVILGCMLLDMFAVIFGGAGALLPIYANEILHVGPRGFGILTASLEAGALLCSLVLVAAPPIRRAGPVLLGAVAVYGVATLVFGLSRSFPLSVAAYLVVGVADQVSVVMRSSAIQLATPDALRGRVASINLIFIGASNQLGAMESGFVAAVTSATFAVVSGGIGCLVVLGIVAWRVPELRRHRLGDAGSAVA